MIKFIRINWLQSSLPWPHLWAGQRVWPECPWSSQLRSWPSSGPGQRSPPGPRCTPPSPADVTHHQCLWCPDVTTHPLISPDPDGREGHLSLQARHDAAVEGRCPLSPHDVTQSGRHSPTGPQHSTLAWWSVTSDDDTLLHVTTHPAPGVWPWLCPGGRWTGQQYRPRCPQSPAGPPGPAWWGLAGLNSPDGDKNDTLTMCGGNNIKEKSWYFSYSAVTSTFWYDRMMKHVTKISPFNI